MDLPSWRAARSEEAGLRLWDVAGVAVRSAAPRSNDGSVHSSASHSYYIISQSTAELAMT